MNEKLKELARQAEFGTVHLLDHYGTVDALTDSEQQTLEKLEKFAELIILECCSALRPILRDMISRNQGVRLINEHFAAEESSSVVITAAMVKRLREETDKTMMDCKMALYACDGDHEQAKQWLLDTRNFRTRI